jgi:hypothetical protein
MVFKWCKLPFTYWFIFTDPKKGAFLLWYRLAKELDNFCWLVNNINIRCLGIISLLCGALWAIERYFDPLAAWWLLINFMINYLGSTKTAKTELRRFLGFSEEYVTWVITVKEPSSPERNSSSDEDSDESDKKK